MPLFLSGNKSSKDKYKDNSHKTTIFINNIKAVFGVSFVLIKVDDEDYGLV